jgi:receptor expression-enhancing protein 5/6
LYFLLIFVNVGGVGQLLANFATLVIPGYYSLVALESHSTRDDIHYLTYWVVYAAFSVFEFWSNAILYWIPFYWLFKTVLFLYLGLPQYNGARWVYQTVVRPFSVSVLGVNSHEAASSLKEKVNEAALAAEGHSSGVDL